MIFQIVIISLFFLSGSLNTRWVYQNSGTQNNLLDLHFFNPDTGIVVGENGTVIKTTDAGQNWFSLNIPLTETIHSIFFLDANTGFVLSPSKLLRTTDAGISWNIVRHSDTSLNSVCFFQNSSTGFLLGNCLVYKSTDAGINWFSIYSCPNSPSGEGKLSFNLSELAHDTIIMTAGIQVNSHVSSGAFIIKLTPSTNYIYSPGSWGPRTRVGFIKFDRNSGVGYTFISGLYYVSHNFGPWSIYSNFPGFVYAPTFYGNLAFVINSDKKFYYQNDQTDRWIFYADLITPALRAVITKIKLLNMNELVLIGYNGLIIRNNNLFFQDIKSTDVSRSIKLLQNYPNPFNQNTIIRFDLSNNSFVKLIIFDVLGREVATLVDKELAAGKYETNWSADNLPSGVYYYRLSVDNFIESGKFIITR